MLFFLFFFFKEETGIDVEGLLEFKRLVFPSYALGRDFVLK
mgnify:CR=1 FL=1